MIWIYLSEELLYLCFALLMGAFIIQLIPDRFKPQIVIPEILIRFSVVGIAVFSIAPVIRLIHFIYEDIGLGTAIQNVLFRFEVGKSWSITAVLALFLLLYVMMFPVLKSKLHAGISLAITFLLLLVLGRASHSASVADWGGFIAHSLHFLAVSVWIGILLIVGWFSKNQTNWLAYLKWFTPVAIGSVIIIAGTGIYLMTLVIDVNEYADAWMLPYGQSLLIKHLSIVPVLAFAFINGFWVNRKLKRGEKLNPIPWLRVESVLLFITFVSTAALGQSEPPYSIETSLKGSGPSAAFDYFYTGAIDPAMHVQFSFNTISILCFALAIAFFGMIFYCFRNKIAGLPPFLVSVFFILTLYLGIMVGMV